jgi:hypothetical protein
MEVKRMRRNVGKIGVGLLIGIGLVIIWLRFIELDKMIEYLKNTNPMLVLMANCLFFMAYFIRSLRWRIILEPIEKISKVEAFKLYMVGLAATFLLPFHTGEVAQPIVLRYLKGTPISRSLPSIVVDRTWNLIPIFPLFLIVPLLSIRLDSLVMGIMVFILMMLGIILVIIIFSIKRMELMIRIGKGLIGWLPQRIEKRLDNFITCFIEAMVAGTKGKPERISSLVGLTLLAMLVECLHFQVLFYATGYHLPFLIAFFGYTLIYFASILPPPPGRIGTNQAIWLLVFTITFGLDKNLVSAVVTISHLLTGILICIIGILSLGLIGISLSKVVRLSTVESEN